MTTETLNTLARATKDATPEELDSAAVYLAGIKYAQDNPDSEAAAIVREITGIISHRLTGNRQSVMDLTNRLADLLKERN